MSAPLPTPHEAAGLLDTADRMHATVRGAASWRYIAWLTGMAVATVMYLVAMGLVGDEREVLVLTAPFLLCIAVLCLALLPGARVNSAGFGRRWGAAVGGWGALYGASMGIGLGAFRGEIGFWAVAALVTALPLLWGARAETRA